MTKNNGIQRVNLCNPTSPCGCPEVVVDMGKKEITIGEADHVVRLNQEAWNMLVDKIQTGELKKI
jgi:hypothetical protein